jgi:hypothetical protein
MPKFKIYASFISYAETTIEAETLEDAKRHARNMDGGDFSHSGYGDWHVDEVEEVNHEI